MAAPAVVLCKIEIVSRQSCSTPRIFRDIAILARRAALKLHAASARVGVADSVVSRCVATGTPLDVPHLVCRQDGSFEAVRPSLVACVCRNGLLGRRLVFFGDRHPQGVGGRQCRPDEHRAEREYRSELCDSRHDDTVCCSTKQRNRGPFRSAIRYKLCMDRPHDYGWPNSPHTARGTQARQKMHHPLVMAGDLGASCQATSIIFIPGQIRSGRSERRPQARPAGECASSPTRSRSPRRSRQGPS